jgi:acyl-coenzyme A thioesterase PaaI-like protein
MNIAELPFNAHLGIRVSERDGKLLELPAAERNSNHLNTVHASAQMALAEAASGELLLRVLKATAAVLPVVRRFGAKFRKPGTGTLLASAKLSGTTAEELEQQLSIKSRAIVPVEVEIHTEDGTHTLSATVEWYLQTISKP